MPFRPTTYVIPSVAEESRRPPLTPLKNFRFLGYARNDTGGYTRNDIGGCAWNDVLEGGDLLPGFAVPVWQLFRRHR